ncbi:ribonuclease H [Sesbania bispinosa]|nr:ribonuclease H [Sesbania bispinosa]
MNSDNGSERHDSEKMDSPNQENSDQPKETENFAEDASFLHNTTPQNPYGPWMLVKRPPRRRLSGNHDKDREKGVMATGSRFNVLGKENEPTETAQPEIEEPILLSEQKITKVRDPSAGKNSQHKKKKSYRGNRLIQENQGKYQITIFKQRKLLLLLKKRAKNLRCLFFLTSFRKGNIYLFQPKTRIKNSENMIM